MNKLEEFYCPYIQNCIFFKDTGFGQMVVRKITDLDQNTEYRCMALDYSKQRAKEFREKKRERHPESEIGCSHLELLNLGIQLKDLVSYIATMEDRRQIKEGAKEE